VMPFVRDYEAFHDTLGNAEAVENVTKLYDAIHRAGEEIVKFASEYPNLLEQGDEPCKFRIFCLTDGEDNASTLKYWNVAKYLQEHKITLDAFPLSIVNPTLQAMTAATGGLCLTATDMEKGVALFEREAILHISSRDPSSVPLPIITDENSIKALFKTSKTVADIKSTPSPAIVQKATIAKDDIVKVEAQVNSTPSSSGSVKRIWKEYRELLDTPAAYWTPYVTADDCHLWKSILEGPKGSPYENGRWIVSYQFPQDYPFKPPMVRFLVPIYHCNINNDGKICLDILKDSWSPALTARHIFNSLTALLLSPNPMDALDSVKANVYSDNKDTYNRLAAEHKERNAMQSLDELKLTYQIKD